MRIGVDTNVFYYAVNEESPYHEEALQNLEHLLKHEVPVTTQQNLLELAVALGRRGTTPEED